MSVEIAEQRGQVSPKKASPARCPPDSGIAGLAAYLEGEGAKILEQEELDPVLPDLSAVDRDLSGAERWVEGAPDEATLVGENGASSDF